MSTHIGVGWDEDVEFIESIEDPNDFPGGARTLDQVADLAAVAAILPPKSVYLGIKGRLVRSSLR
jgi:hypothetical protein